MQLEQNIPTLGGLGGPPQRSRREQLASDGERARGEIASLLGKAHRRVVAPAGGRAGGLLLARLSPAPLAGALGASADGALLGLAAVGPRSLGRAGGGGG